MRRVFKSKSAIVIVLIISVMLINNWYDFITLTILFGAVAFSIYRICDTENINFNPTLFTNGRSMIDVNGILTHYELSNSHGRNTIILIPGMSVPYYIWDSTFQALVKQNFTVLRYDYPGRGFSERPNIKYDSTFYRNHLHGIIKKLNVPQPVHLIGVSFGGLVAADFASCFPNIVDKVVLIGPMYRMPFVICRDLFVFLFAIGWLFIAKQQSKDFKYPENFPFWTDLYKEQMRVKGFRNSVISTLFDYQTNNNVYERLNKTNKQILLIHGTDDNTISAKSTLCIKKALNAKILPINDTGHLPHLEKAKEVNEKIISFLNE